eukprot:scaffold4797_cov152-Skeletonema_marinoi.AAC.26
MASSGHLRRCSDADTANKYLSREKDASILSWPTSHETPMGSTYWETLLFFACLGHWWEGVGTLVGNAPIPTNLPQNSFPRQILGDIIT